MSNRLVVLAADIRSAHEDVRRAHEQSAQRAVDAGKWLSEAKADPGMPRGSWARWVEKDAGLPWSTAKHYIKIFRAVSEQRLTLADVAELGQNAALKAAADEASRLDNAGKVAAVWDDDQTQRKEWAEQGLCVIANMHEGYDEALIAWAEAEERFVRIDRRSEWGNPFEMPDDGGRAEVIGKFTKFYLPYKDGLLTRMPTLRGKVLGCWCYPEECHGHLIAEIVNRESVGPQTAGALADYFAALDGCGFAAEDAGL